MSIFEYIKDLFYNPQKYTKFWTALASVWLTILTQNVKNAPWLPYVIQSAGALGVFVLPNKNKPV